MDVHEDAPIRCVHGVALDGDCVRCDAMNGGKRYVGGAIVPDELKRKPTPAPFLTITYEDVLEACVMGLEQHAVDAWPEDESCTGDDIRREIKKALDVFLATHGQTDWKKAARAHLDGGHLAMRDRYDEYGEHVIGQEEYTCTCREPWKHWRS